MLDVFKSIPQSIKKKADVLPFCAFPKNVAGLGQFVDIAKDVEGIIEGSIDVPLSVLAPIILKIPTSDGVIPLSYDKRPHLRKIVDSYTRIKKVYLLFGRQTEKSSTLAAVPLMLSTLLRMTTQYTSGTLTQAMEFSHWKLDGTISNSELLKNLCDQRGVSLMYNRKEKEFYTGSRILVGTAFGDAARIRGVPADDLEMDELELYDIEVVPVLQHAFHHSPFKFELHAATPLSTENTAWVYWDKYSIQHEWAIPCDCRASFVTSGTAAINRYHWNILGPKNLSRKGPICELCGKLIDTLQGDWVCTTEPAPERTWHAFRFPQLAAVYTDYNDIVVGMEQRPIETLQESFALSVTQAEQVFTDSLIAAISDSTMPNSEEYVIQRGGVYPYFVGIDWGAGGSAATVVVLGAYVDNVFVFMGGFRYYDPGVSAFGEYNRGEELEAHLPFINLLRQVKISKIGADFGAGYSRNNMLISVFGPERMTRILYTNQNEALKVQPYDLLVKANRNEMLNNFVTSLKLSPKKFRLPRIPDMKAVHWYQDLMAVKLEVDRKGNARYIHSAQETDDFFHAMFNCLLSSHLVFPRRDLFPAALFSVA